MAHSFRPFDWDDLKYLLGVARHGSTLAAGRAMGVDQSTVQRRLGELERRLGRALVQRHPTGYRLTEFGAEMVPHAEQVEAAVLAFERRLDGAEHEAGGVIRLTCPEPIVHRLQGSGLLDRFQAAYPKFRLQIVTSDRFLDLHKGEADVALRSGDTDDDELVGRKIADSIWAVYASAGYLERHGRPASIEDLAHHALIGFDESMRKHRVATWMQRVAPHNPPVARNDSVLGLLYSVRAGLGVGPLPTPLGDAQEGIERVLGPVPELCRVWRVLTTSELRRTPRVAAFFDFVVREIEDFLPILTG